MPLWLISDVRLAHVLALQISTIAFRYVLLDNVIWYLERATSCQVPIHTSPRGIPVLKYFFPCDWLSLRLLVGSDTKVVTQVGALILRGLPDNFVLARSHEWICHGRSSLLRRCRNGQILHVSIDSVRFLLAATATLFDDLRCYRFFDCWVLWWDRDLLFVREVKAIDYRLFDCARTVLQYELVQAQQALRTYRCVCEFNALERVLEPERAQQLFECLQEVVAQLHVAW